MFSAHISGYLVDVAEQQGQVAQVSRCDSYLCSHSLGILAVEALTSELACVVRIYMAVYHEMAPAAQSLPALVDLLLLPNNCKAFLSQPTRFASSAALRVYLNARSGVRSSVCDRRTVDLTHNATCRDWFVG